MHDDAAAQGGLSHLGRVQRVALQPVQAVTQVVRRFRCAATPTWPNSPCCARAPALERLLADQFRWPLPTWVAMHEDLRQNAACRVVFDALVEGLSRHVAAA